MVPSLGLDTELTIHHLSDRARSRDTWDLLFSSRPGVGVAGSTCWENLCSRLPYNPTNSEPSVQPSLDIHVPPPTGHPCQAMPFPRSPVHLGILLNTASSLREMEGSEDAETSCARSPMDAT